MFETGDFQTPAPPESGVAGNAVASTPQDHWLLGDLLLRQHTCSRCHYSLSSED